MRNLALILKNLSRKQKLFVMTCSDAITAFFCWVVFGPPFSFMIATNFESSLKQVIFQNYLSFLIPFVFTFIYFYASGFYRSLLKFFDSKDTILRGIIGSLLFGFL